MALTKSDIQQIKVAVQDIVETELDKKMESLNEFAEFAKPALEALLDESQKNFLHNLPERVKKLESIHPSNTHAN